MSLSRASLALLFLASCSSPNPGYLGDGPRREGGSVEGLGHDRPETVDLGTPERRDLARGDGPRLDARRDGPVADGRRDGPQPDLRRDALIDTRPPDTRPPDTRPPDGPPLIGCAAPETVATGTLGEASSAHLTLDGAGNPQVGYLVGSTVRHAIRGAATWASQVVASASSPTSVRVAVFKPSATLEHLEVVYDSVSSGTRRLYHRWRSATSTGWNGPASVDSNLEVEDLDLAASTTALRIAGSGELTIGPGLFQAYRVWGPTWVNAPSSYLYPASYTHNNGAVNVRYPRVAAGPTHFAATAYLGGATPSWQLRREPIGAGSGSTTSVSAANFIQAPAAITVDGAGSVHLAAVGQNFPAPANAGLYYAFWAGGAVAPSPQQLGSATYHRLALDIDHDGTDPQIVYVEVGTGGGAKWIRRQAAIWSAPVTVAPGGVVGTRLAVDGAKRLAHFVFEAYAGGQYTVSYRVCSY